MSKCGCEEKLRLKCKKIYSCVECGEKCKSRHGHCKCKKVCNCQLIRKCHWVKK